MNPTETHSIEQMVLNTLVFRRGENNQLNSLLDDKQIPNSADMTADKLKEYYSNKLDELKSADESFEMDKIPDTEKLKEDYINVATQMMTYSEVLVGNTIYYLDPLEPTKGFKEDNLEDYLKHFTEKTNTTITTHLSEKTSLPVLMNKAEWKKMVEREKEMKFLPLTIQTVPKEQIDLKEKIENGSNATGEKKESPPSEPKFKGGIVPDNLTIGFVNASSNGISVSENASKDQSSNILRQRLAPTLFKAEKHTYLRHFRNYVRILRRLSNFVLIQRGLLEEVIYMKYYQRKKEDNTFDLLYDINQPFFKHYSVEERKLRNERMAEFMEIRKFRLNPYTRGLK